MKSGQLSRSFRALMDIDISFSFSEKLFSSFRLTLEEGEHILIIAEPGKGKSTLARILTGTVPAYAQGELSGSVMLSGQDILKLAVPERLPIVSRVSQNTDEMLLFSSVEEELSFPLENLALDRAEIDRRKEEAIRLFSLEDLRTANPAELSGGEKRRLMLAILFAIDPYLYIFDESFDELSPSWRERLREMMLSSKKTMLFLGSHYLSEYEGLFDRVLTIEDGKCAEYRGETMPCQTFRESGNSWGLSVRNLLIERGRSFSLLIDSFDLRGGECVTILGENGSGKSSFARVLSGLLKEASGTVLSDGKEIPFRERRRRCAYLMQNPYQELFLPKVIDELKSTGKDESEIEEALTRFHLDREAYVSELSYGKAKLLQAAVFYLLRRPVAIFDEFDSALSYRESAEAASAFLEQGALIVITHDRKFASLLPGRKLEMKGGLYEY